MNQPRPFSADLTSEGEGAPPAGPRLGAAYASRAGHRGARPPATTVQEAGAADGASEDSPVHHFDLRETLAERGGERYGLHSRHLNHQLPRMLHTIGFDRDYERAEGAYLYDAEGRDYLDMLAGFGVMGLGRHHPVVRRALHDVLDAQLADLTRFDCPPLSGLLAERLLSHAPGLDRVYFGNSGTEAVEAALKFARRATDRPRVLHCDHAFHGLTAGSLSACGEPSFRDGFDPLLPDTSVPLGDLDALERELRRGDVAALIVEPVQGKGVHPAPPGYLRAAGRLLRRHGALLIVDEVQTGLGRTGAFFAYQHEEGVEPDLVCVAKALSGGYVPVSATLGRDWIFKRVYSSMDRVLVHSASFGANAQAMAAGLATLAVLEGEGLVDHARRMGQLLHERLAALTDRYELLHEVRGRGLMLGIEFGRPSSLALRGRWTMLRAARKGLFAQLVVVPLLHRHRILTQVSGDELEVIKLLPPLIITEREVDRFVEAFTQIMDDAHGGNGLMWEFGRTLIKQAAQR